MNNIHICGNVGEPEMRFTTGGKGVLSFGLATSRKSNDETFTTWHNVKCFGTLAENLASTLTKGDRVMVSGRVDVESWEDKTSGDKRTKVVVIADEAGISMRWLKDR